MLAEHVLRSVLDACPVDVREIEAAIDSLHLEPEPVPQAISSPRQALLERIAEQAAAVVATKDVFGRAANDEIDDDPEDAMIAFYAAVDALMPLLDQLAHV